VASDHGLDFDALRQTLLADGADLKLIEVAADFATVELLFGPETCVECILPRSSLMRILQVALRREYPGVQRVELIDPRES
jgi:Fe-S cluster biogenesis protein NfuA